MTTSIAGFEDLEEMHRSSTSLVLRGVRSRDGQRVILKTTADRRPSGALIANLLRERRLAAKAQGDHVVRLLDALDVEGAPVLVFEDFGGRSLDRVPDALPFEERLHLALDIVRGVEAVHARGVMHKDINPTNLVWNRATSTVKLVDFSIASDLEREAPERSSHLEGTIRYIAPEQTGRMSCGVDRRADLYSVGVTLYELFSGALPFESDDVLELVHAHLARVPPALRERDAAVPEAVSDIVMRLLEKAPERRYETAAGLYADLARCAEQLAAEGRIDAFELGAKDHDGTIDVPHTLYGRDADRRVLLDAFDAAAHGGRAFVLVSGAPGIGKTSLVREVYLPIAERRGDFLEGKFDQFRMGVPYAPLGRAFGRFLRWVLTQPDDAVARWRERLGRAVGRNGAVLVEILPELAALLGPQEPVQVLSPTEAENRFHLAFRGLVEAIATQDQPIALFLDDLQWADVPTLRLLERIVTDADVRYLLVIGAYRDNEIDAGHPLHLTLDNVRRGGVEPASIALRALTEAQVQRLLRGTFAQDGRDVEALATVCAAKTGGNPFFLRRFLETLGERGVVRWDAAALRWTWSVADIEAVEHTANVIDFLLDRIRDLPQEALRALQCAACIGDSFDLRLLGELMERLPSALQAALRPAVTAALVAPQGRGWILDAGDHRYAIPDEAYRYVFVHDRIRQAAYASMDEEGARAVHYRLGKLIARRGEGDGDAGWLFDALNHSNKAMTLAQQPEERATLARMNLDAGRRAMRAAAFGPAEGYLEAGLALLPGDAWATQYDLALALHADAAECAYLTANFERLEARVGAVRAHARSLLDRIKALEIEMEALLARGDLRGAVGVALQALAQLGSPMPESPGDAEVGAAVQRAMGVLATVSIDDFEELADVDDPVVAAAQRILVRASSPAYYVLPALLPMLACELVVTSVQRGLSPATPFGLAVYGIVLNSFGMLAEAHAYGELAGRLIDRWDDRRLEARTKLVINNNVCPWIVPLASKLDSLRDAYRVGRDTGDLEYAAICGQCYATDAFSAGCELGKLLEDAELFGGFIRNYGQVSILRLHEPLVQLVRALAGELEDPARLDGPGYDEDAAIASALATGSASLLFVTLSDALVARYHFASGREAFEVAERARPFQPGAVSTYHLVNFHTYAPLAASRCFEAADDAERPALLARIDESIAQLAVWAAAGPMNHLHRLLMVQAERARVEGRLDEATALFHRAVEAVRETTYVNDEALICELTARCYLDRGGACTTIGRAFLEDAAFAYQRWGAVAKVRRLQEDFPRLLDGAAARRAVDTHSSVNTLSGLDVDAVAVVRAATTISAEIELDQLLATLFRIIMEAGGAQRALLLLERGGRWEVAVEGAAEGAPAMVRKALDELAPEDYPLAALRFVLRTGETVLIDDAAVSGTPMDGDAYARTHGSRSVLCLPVRHRSAVTSLLFLEHAGATGVFTEERTGLLKLLMSQAAVSIHNAQLFEEQLRLTRAQSRFVPHQFLESLDRHDIAEVRLGDAVSKTMTVCFSDLRNFTTMAEVDDANTVIQLLNDYFAAMEPHIVEARGFIDSFNGDEIMALFDVPPECAVRAGVRMQAALERFNLVARRSLRMGIGINTGPVVLGTVGGRDRIKCGVVGDAVNVASRVEGLTKRYGARVLIADATHDALPPSMFSLRPVDRVAVKGRQGAQTIYEVLDAASAAERPAKERSRAALERAMERYYARDFGAAAVGFAACRDLAPTDLVPSIFLERCQRFAEAPPPDDWSGVDRLG